MAIDLNAIKQKLNELNTTNSRRNNLWKPSAGEQIIRIVPYQYDTSNPFRELYFHYDLGKKNYLSPITYGKDDPVVEFCEKLKSSGNSDEWKLGRKMEPKMRTYVPILVRGEESEGVKFWGFGKTVYQELLGFIADPDYGDITDPKSGRDIVVEFTPSSGPGSYPSTKIRVKPKVTPMTDDRNVLEAVAKNQQDLSEIFKEPTYDELKEALENWLDPEADDSATDNATSEEPAAKEEPADSVSKVSDVGKAFDDLFND